MLLPLTEALHSKPDKPVLLLDIAEISISVNKDVKPIKNIIKAVIQPLPTVPDMTNTSLQVILLSIIDEYPIGDLGMFILDKYYFLSRKDSDTLNGYQFVDKVPKHIITDFNALFPSISRETLASMDHTRQCNDIYCTCNIC